MRRIPFSKPSSLFADGIIFCLLAALIYGVVAFSTQWEAQYNPSYEIDLSLGALPLYSLFSALRGFIAYLVSLAFTLTVGYWAAKNPRAEKIILPLLDVMQSIPVLGFLPGLVLGLVAIFPRTNVGLELSAVLMIFTGQVWNMAFAFYSSLKSVPTDLKEAASVMKLSPLQRLELLELPYSAMNLTWNSVMSMAGGWFFLTVCEAFTLGDKTYRLPGLGAYMAVAIEKGDVQAILGGIGGMTAVILLFDLLLWRPLLVWAHRFRLEEGEGDQKKIDEPLIQLLIRDSVVVRLFKAYYFRHNRTKWDQNLRRKFTLPQLQIFERRKLTDWQRKIAFFILGVASALVVGYGTAQLIKTLTHVNSLDWLSIIRDTAFTLMRVLVSVAIGTLWAVPVGIWVVQTPKRLRIAQPIIQLMASFPAPMLYPLAIGVFLVLHINFEISAMLLMLLGVQWYILFNVLAGALRIPTELRLGMRLMGTSKWHQWRYLFLPSVLPSLVTGWVTAAGGAWNASIVSELIEYKGTSLEAHGLGAQISKAAAHGDFSRLAACLFVMVIVVVTFNRTVWAKLYRVAQTRFRLDL